MIDGAIIKGLSGSPVILKPFLMASVEEDEVVFYVHPNHQENTDNADVLTIDETQCQLVSDVRAA